MPGTMNGGARDMVVDKTHSCGPPCHGVHSLEGKIDTEYKMTREPSVGSSRGCRAVVAESQGIWKGPARKRGRSYQIGGMEEYKRAS